ncbi:glycosyltransferase family 2 protein [Anaerosporobacter faecicola]|uniref:glycosyltransferase family 2 protein n=1 Tax=Anaerosporobacter faecicola TaxID=2718714 RepID=UPI001439113E|nr:glycosyltransferase family 2 protein [Anaerosporobacter faecicola]
MIEIIMAAYNGEKYIGEQVDSIMKNTYTDIKVTVYDDTKEKGNIEGMEHISATLFEKYGERFHYIRNESNKGCAKNFLEGLRQSTEEYVMFSDQDDHWNRDKIQLTLEKMKKMEESYGKDTPLAVFTDAAVVDENLSLLHLSFHRSNHLNTEKLDLPHLLMENKLNGCTMMMNRALCKKIEVIPEHARMHDWWIALVAATFGKIGYLEEPTMLYRQHTGNVVGNQEYASYIKKRLANLQQQKEAIASIREQASELLLIYHDQMTEKQRECVKRFVELNKNNWFYRRYAICRYGYLKSGLPRNLGLFLII